MDMKNLKTFLYVAELANFTRAAELLGFSQSTVSFQIKQLETEFNVKLFERINHTVKLTEQGREFLRYAHQMDKITKELTANLKEEKYVTGHIRLVEQGCGCSFLPDYVSEASVREGRMVRLAVEDFEIDIWKQLFYHRDKWVSPQMQAVIDSGLLV